MHSASCKRAYTTICNEALGRLSGSSSCRAGCQNLEAMVMKKKLVNAACLPLNIKYSMSEMKLCRNSFHILLWYLIGVLLQCFTPPFNMVHQWSTSLPIWSTGLLIIGPLVYKIGPPVHPCGPPVHPCGPPFYISPFCSNHGVNISTIARSQSLTAKSWVGGYERLPS